MNFVYSFLVLFALRYFLGGERGSVDFISTFANLVDLVKFLLIFKVENMEISITVFDLFM